LEARLNFNRAFCSPEENQARAKRVFGFIWAYNEKIEEHEVRLL